MTDITSTSGLLFNTLFLRLILIVPIAITGYVLFLCIKQNKDKFKNKPLINTTSSEQK